MVVCLIVSIIAHTYILLYIDRSIFDIANILIIALSCSLLINNRITTLFLLFFSAFVIVFEFVPLFLFDEKVFEKIYYDISFGSSFSSYLREYILHKNFISRLFINIFGGLHFILAIYALIIEIPIRLYKAQRYLVNKGVNFQN